MIQLALPSQPNSASGALAAKLHSQKITRAPRLSKRSRWLRTQTMMERSAHSNLEKTAHSN